MSKTIRHRILDILTARLRNALVCESYSYAPSSVLASDVLEYMKPVSTSGTYNAVKPRAYSIAVIAANTVTITDATLWAESGPNHPVIAPVVQAYISGTPFELGGTGIFFTITHNITNALGSPIVISTNSLIGKSWNVVIAKATETVRSIEAYRTAWSEESYPRLAIFPGEESPVSNGVIESSTKRLQINLLLDIRFESFNNGRIEELFGDLLNEVLRDIYFYDNTNCLAQNCEYLGSTLYESDNIEETSFALSFEITYRNKLTDTREIS